MPQKTHVDVQKEKRRGIQITRLTLKSPNIPRAFQGYRIIHLSDLHFGPATTLSHLERVFSLCNTLNPDLIAINGDLLQISAFGLREYFAKRVGPQAVKWTLYRRLVRRTAKQLASAILTLKAADGILGTFGNHDYYEGVFTIRRQIPIKWLKNQTHSLKRGGAFFTISGVDDWKQGEPKLEKVSSREESPGILLSHNPDITLADNKRLLHSHLLVLCGHTHGGQIRLPGLPPLLTRTKQKKFYQGLGFFERKTPIYVSNGVGYGVIPVRTFCPPEIVSIELQPALS